MRARYRSKLNEVVPMISLNSLRIAHTHTHNSYRVQSQHRIPDRHALQQHMSLYITLCRCLCLFAFVSFFSCAFCTYGHDSTTNEEKHKAKQNENLLCVKMYKKNVRRIKHSASNWRLVSLQLLCFIIVLLFNSISWYFII